MYIPVDYFASHLMGVLGIQASLQTVAADV